MDFEAYKLLKNDRAFFLIITRSLPQQTQHCSRQRNHLIVSYISSYRYSHSFTAHRDS